jgi:ATP-dependent DNA ligase
MRFVGRSRAIYCAMLYRVRPRPPVGFIQPCLPCAAAMPPAGPNWIHEIKHDGFRIIKMKNPSAPAVKREAEEDWSKEKWR